MSTQPLVLVADDEPRITKLVAIALSEEGFRVVTANGGEQALQKAEEVRPDIVLLDIVMPDLDGIEVMRQLRERRPVPVILLTAKGSTADKAKGLDLGADDYIAKPFHPDELAARVRAVIRRSGGAEPGAGVIKFDDVEIDLERRMVTRNGELVQLSRTEWLLLQHLAANAGKVVLHTELLTKVWGPEYRDDLQYLRVWVSRVRRKLGARRASRAGSGRSRASATCSMSTARPRAVRGRAAGRRGARAGERRAHRLTPAGAAGRHHTAFPKRRRATDPPGGVLYAFGQFACRLADPDVAVRELLGLPDRGAGLGLVDGVARGLEGRVAVRRARPRSRPMARRAAPRRRGARSRAGSRRSAPRSRRRSRPSRPGPSRHASRRSATRPSGRRGGRPPPPGPARACPAIGGSRRGSRRSRRPPGWPAAPPAPRGSMRRTAPT